MPRATGEVRAATDVSVISAPLPSRPRRMSRSAGKFHPPELRTINIRNPVVLRQPLIDEGVIRRQQIQDAAVLMDHAAEEQFDLALECRPQVIVEIRKQIHLRIAGLAGSARSATAR